MRAAGPDRSPGALRRSAARRLVDAFLTLRGRLHPARRLRHRPALLFIFLVAVRERESALERMETEARHLGGLASREHAHQLNGARSLLRRLDSLLPCEGRSGSAMPTCPDYLPALLSGFPQFANIGIASPRGDVTCSAAPLPHPATLRTNAAFERALASTGVEAGTYVVGFVGRPVLHLAYALRRRAPRARWRSSLSGLAAGSTTSPSRRASADYSLLIADRTGQVLARSRRGHNDFLAERGRPDPALAEALQRPRGAVLRIGSPAAPRYFVATPMEGVPGVFVVAGLPYERGTADREPGVSRTLAALALATIFAVTSAVLAAELSVLRDLRRAHAGGPPDFGAGDLTARPPLPREPRRAAGAGRLLREHGRRPRRAATGGP